MTINCNYPRALPQTPDQKAVTDLLKHIGRQKRRWHLLQRFQNLPQRSWDASWHFFHWQSREWWDAQTNIDNVEEALEQAMHSAHLRDLNWLAFAIGGGRAYVHAYDLGPGNVANFLAGSLFVHDYGFSPADARGLHRQIADMLKFMPEVYRVAGNTGERNAAYWIEQKRKRDLATTWRKPTPPPLMEQPVGYTDLLELQLAQESGVIQ